MFILKEHIITGSIPLNVLLEQNNAAKLFSKKLFSKEIGYGTLQITYFNVRVLRCIRGVSNK